MFDDVARLALSLPRTTEGTRHGNRTWFVDGKAFAWERPFSKADVRRFGDRPVPAGPILAVRTADLDQKDVLLMANPDAFFTIPHFDGYPAVLIRLAAASTDDLGAAIVDGWLACAPRPLAEAYAADPGAPVRGRAAPGTRG